MKQAGSLQRPGFKVVPYALLLCAYDKKWFVELMEYNKINKKNNLTHMILKDLNYCKSKVIGRRARL